MFLFSCYLTGRQIQIPLDDKDVNNFLVDERVFSGGHYSPLNLNCKQLQAKKHPPRMM